MIILFTDNPTNVSSGGTPVGTIVGAIIGVLLVMILGVAIAVVVLYLVRRRSTGGKYLTGRRASEKKVYGMGKYQTCAIMHDGKCHRMMKSCKGTMHHVYYCS